MTSLDPGGVGGYHLDHKCNRWQRCIDRNRHQRGRLLGLDPGVHHRNCKSYFFKDYFPCTDHCTGKGNKKRNSVRIRMWIILFLGHPVWCFNHIRADNISHYDNSCRSYHLRGTCHNADSFQGAYRDWGWNALIDRKLDIDWRSNWLILNVTCPIHRLLRIRLKKQAVVPKSLKLVEFSLVIKRLWWFFCHHHCTFSRVKNWYIYIWIWIDSHPRHSRVVQICFFSKFYRQFV